MIVLIFLIAVGVVHANTNDLPRVSHRNSILHGIKADSWTVCGGHQVQHIDFNCIAEARMVPAEILYTVAFNPAPAGPGAGNPRAAATDRGAVYGPPTTGPHVQGGAP